MWQGTINEYRIIRLTRQLAGVLIPVVALAVSFLSCTSGGEPKSGPFSKISAVLQADSCDDPDANIHCMFTGMPPELNNMMNIADENEPGERLVIKGVFYKSDGKTPEPGVVLYAYHTDHTGHYSKKGNETGVQKWHGYLHGWCKTGADGQYEIHTIRPARYPDNSMPAHIHMAVKTGDRAFYITDFVFRDDELVNDRYLKSIRGQVGGSGVVDLKRTAAGDWTGERNIILLY